VPRNGSAFPKASLDNIPGGGPVRFFALLEKDPPPPPLTNPSFENPIVEHGQFDAIGEPWTSVDLPPNNAFIETWNPQTINYATIPDGNNVCSVFVESGLPGTPFGVSQSLEAVFALNTDYTLTVAVGRATFYDWSGFRTELWADGVLLAFDEDPTTAAPAPGTFITSTLTYDHLTGPSATSGATLEIRLLSRGVDVNGVVNSALGWSVEFDDVVFSISGP
jgi:hypothetical protein